MAEYADVAYPYIFATLILLSISYFVIYKNSSVYFFKNKYLVIIQVVLLTYIIVWPLASPSFCRNVMCKSFPINYTHK